MMAKKMETTIMGYLRYIFGSYRDQGKENGNYYRGLQRKLLPALGLLRDL